MRNIFIEKCGGETSPRPYSEKLKLSISLNTVFPLLYGKLRAIEIYQNYAVDPLLSPHIIFLQADKKRSCTSLPASFSA